MTDGRYPGYDVMDKRHTPSWNEQTRQVIDKRLALPREPQFFTEAEWVTLNAICGRIVPQPRDRAPIPVPTMVDHKMHTDSKDGYRNARLPPMQEAWRRGLHAMDEEARRAYGVEFHRLDAAEQDALLKRAQEGELNSPAWGDMPAKLFFKNRMVHDIIHGYYAFPAAWNEIGFGGPASPRGYVRMGFNRRDSWEAVEVKNGDVATARKENQRVG